MGSRGIALDIDNTLADTNTAWIGELVQRFGNPENISAEEIQRTYIHATDAPFWQSEEAQAWARAARRANDYHENLPLIENVNHIVNRINADIPIKAYVTGRWEVLREATESWLWRHEFPRAPVYMRPMNSVEVTVNEWKAPFLETLYPEIVGIIDDDPRLLEFLSHEYPGTIYLYKNTKHVDTPVDVVSCSSWEAVEKTLRQRFL